MLADGLDADGDVLGGVPEAAPVLRDLSEGELVVLRVRVQGALAAVHLVLPVPLLLHDGGRALVDARGAELPVERRVPDQEEFHLVVVAEVEVRVLGVVELVPEFHEARPGLRVREVVGLAVALEAVLLIGDAVGLLADELLLLDFLLVDEVARLPAVLLGFLDADEFLEVDLVVALSDEEAVDDVLAVRVGVRVVHDDVVDDAEVGDFSRVIRDDLSLVLDDLFRLLLLLAPLLILLRLVCAALEQLLLLEALELRPLEGEALVDVGYVVEDVHGDRDHLGVEKEKVDPALEVVDGLSELVDFALAREIESRADDCEGDGQEDLVEADSFDQVVEVAVVLSLFFGLARDQDFRVISGVDDQSPDPFKFKELFRVI